MERIVGCVRGVTRDFEVSFVSLPKKISFTFSYTFEGLTQ